MEQEKDGLTVDPQTYFKIRDYEILISKLDIEIDEITLQRERLLYEYQLLTEPTGSPEEEKPVEEKPKKLKKTNDQSSKDNAEVSI